MFGFASTVATGSKTVYKNGNTIIVEDVLGNSQLKMSRLGKIEQHTTRLSKELLKQKLHMGIQLA